MQALGLDRGTPAKETFRRMYLFQKLGIIRMSKKVIRILEGACEM